MKKKKKRKLKKQVYYLLAILVALIVAGILGMNFYNDYQYKQTDEYSILDKGYTIEDAKILKDKLSHDEIMTILAKEKNDIIIALIQEKYFLFKNLDTYLEYQKKNDEKEIHDIIAIVNVHANNKWYNKEFKTDTSLNELMNVNKFYALSEQYNPKNLKSISLKYAYGNEGENKLIDYAYEKFIELWQAANEEGYYLMVNSSYRDYQEQKELYDYRKNTQGERKADETAARPGHSEHQTGLVIDMTSKSNSDSSSFSESKEYQWLKENAHKYGWIERYPQNKTYLTGYAPEPWHWRYVGEEAATIIYNEKITYDEYYAYYIEKN